MRLSAIRASLQALQQLVEHRISCKGFESLLKGIKVVDGGNGCCVCEFSVNEDVVNSLGMLHGGMSATLVDAVSTWALMTTTKPGVSVDLSVSYMKAASHLDTLVIDARTLKVGKNLAFLTVDIKNKETGKLLAQGKHTKFIA